MSYRLADAGLGDIPTAQGVCRVGADVVLVGLDGADRTEVARLADEGRLPVIARMRAQGRWGTLDAFDGLGDDAAWCSFATGVGPGRHGRPFYSRYTPGTYDWVPANRDDIRADPFWDTLAPSGHRFAILDLPKAPIGRHAHNLVVVDWMSHGAHEAPTRCHSPTWAGQLAGWLDGDDAAWNCHYPGSSDDFVSSLRRRAALRTDFAIDVLQRAQWDAIVVVFAETHCSGHFLWHEFDRVEDVYVAVDEQLGRLVDAAGPASTVIAFSPLGMGPHHSTEQLAGAVLERLDRASGSEVRRTPRGLPALGESIPRAVRDRVPRRVRRLASNERERQRQREFGRRRFWPVPTDLPDTPIRINVIGREPYGKIARGAEFAGLCEDLRQEFLALVEPGTGRRLVRDVLIAREAWPGDAPDDFADLCVVWDATEELAAASSPRIGEVHVVPHERRPAEHRDGGWLVATGPGITHGRFDRSMTVLDFAPTVARLVGTAFDGEGSAIPGVDRPASSQAAVGSTLNADQSSA
jgi:predicted AlkP superfamily phosphohydrolase/phosphomutase